MDYVVRMVNDDTILGMDDGQVNQFEVVYLLEFVIKHGVKCIAEAVEAIYVLNSKDNVVYFNHEDRFIVILVPLEESMI